MVTANEPAPPPEEGGWLIRLQPQCLEFFDIALDEGPATLMAEALSNRGGRPAAGEQILVVREGKTFTLDVLAVSQAAGVQGVQFDFRAPTSGSRLPPKPPSARLLTAEPHACSEALSPSISEATARLPGCPAASIDSSKTPPSVSMRAASYGTTTRGRLFAFQGEGRHLALADPNSIRREKVGIGIGIGDSVGGQSCLPPEAHAEGRRLGHGPLYTSTMTQLQPRPPEHRGNRSRDADEGCSVACQDCGVLVPALNRQLHSLRCHGADLQIRAPRGGQVLSPPRPPNRQARLTIKNEIM